MRDGRRWIWAALVLQLVGYVYDGLWHGVLNPGLEPTTTAGMARHLATVHLPLYLGAASVLVATVTTLLRRNAGSPGGLALVIAVAGAILSAGAEAWHAHDHLHLDTYTAPLAGGLSVVGFLVVVGATWLSSRGSRPTASAFAKPRH